MTTDAVENLVASRPPTIVSSLPDATTISRATGAASVHDAVVARIVTAGAVVADAPVVVDDASPPPPPHRMRP